MKTVRVQALRLMLAGAALLALAATPGCDWLKGSGPGPRSSPVIGSLSIEDAAGVSCGPTHAFQISFRYDDPQDDIFQVRLAFTHLDRDGKADGSPREEQRLWTTFDLDTSPGRAITEYFFACGSPTGRWRLEVEAEDLDGHLSNVLTGEVFLLN